jgi:hypothetical protein
MKCIYCGEISRKREREDGRCPKCRHPFAFEPSTGPHHRITDLAFKQAIDRVSRGRLRFTDRQLWHALTTPLIHPSITKGAWAPAVTWPIIGALPGIVLDMRSEVPGMKLVAGLGAVAGLVLGVALARAEMRSNANLGVYTYLPLDVFRETYLPRWREAHGDIPGLLPLRGAAVAALPRQVPADVAAFSFDRAVVTDRWETAQMLVANRFHFEHNCAVLSVDGYPDAIADTVKEMLRRNPRLTVFALHDASPVGCELPLDLREPEWFPDPAVRIVDLGLRPETVKRLKLLWVRGQDLPRPSRLEGMLTEKELKWLAAGNTCELAAVPPALLMRGAYRGIVAAGPHDGPTRAPVYDGASWTGGAVWFGALGGAAADTAAVDGFG